VFFFAEFFLRGADSRLSGGDQLMLQALRYYWITTKKYRLRPWESPYIQWRLETFFGQEAARLDAVKFFRLMWRERARMKRFLAWVAIRRKAQHSRG
jgi:hypothetical protein